MTTEPPRLPRNVPEWHARAACRNFPDIDWIDAKGTQATAARVICSACPVRYLCARDALERGEPWGMHGGLDRSDRKQLAKHYGYPAPSVLPEHGTNSRYAKHNCRCQDCRNAHAVYEVDRRAKARRKTRQRDVWHGLCVLARPMRQRRRWIPAGQYLLPLDGVPAPCEAETERGPFALAA